MCLSGVSHVCLSSSAAIRASVHTCSAGRAEHARFEICLTCYLASGKWTSRKSGEGGGEACREGGQDQGKVSVGHFRKLPVKAFLRSWPDEDGCMLLTDEQAPSDYFTAAKLAEQLTAESSKWVARLGLGVSMASASLESCAAALAVLPTSSANKKYAQTGIPAIRKRTSLAVANMTSKACADVASSSPHNIEKVLKKLGKKDALKQQVRDFACLADTSSRMYAGAMAGLELRALAANPKAWAKKIPDEPKQDKAVQKFMRKKTQESCVEVASTNTARLEAKAPRKKRAFVDSSEGEAGE